MTVCERVECHRGLGAGAIAIRPSSQNEDIASFQLRDPRHDQPRSYEQERQPRDRVENAGNPHRGERGQTRQDETVERDTPRTPLAEQTSYPGHGRDDDEDRCDPERSAVNEMDAHRQRGYDQPEFPGSIALLLHSRMVRNREKDREPSTAVTSRAVQRFVVACGPRLQASEPARSGPLLRLALNRRLGDLRALRAVQRFVVACGHRLQASGTDRGVG